jgi:hypothetical protein
LASEPRQVKIERVSNEPPRSPAKASRVFDKLRFLK